MRTALALVALVTLTGCSDPAYVADGTPQVTDTYDLTVGGTVTHYDDGLIVHVTTDGHRTAAHPFMGVITEDMPQWDCSRMGNLICGPDAPEPAPYVWDDAERAARTIIRITEAASDRLPN